MIILLGVIYASAVKAEILIAGPMSGFSQSETIYLDKAAWKNIQIFGSSQIPIEYNLTIDFYEDEGFYGFAALICDEENKNLYLDGKSANCQNYEINSAQDNIDLSVQGTDAYYLLIHNKTRPLSVVRNITVTYVRNIEWGEDEKQAVKTQLSSWMDKLSSRLDIRDYNVALVPCQKGYIPSSYDDRTLTLCSELALASDGLLAPIVTATHLMYEAVPFIQQDLDRTLYESEDDRIKLAIAFMLTLVEGDDVLQDLYDWYIENEVAMRNIEQVFQKDNTRFSVDTMFKVVEEYYLEPQTYNDVWLDKVYTTMNDKTLIALREREISHPYLGRNLARLILLDRGNRSAQESTDQENKKSNRDQLRDVVDEIF